MKRFLSLLTAVLTASFLLTPSSASSEDVPRMVHKKVIVASTNDEWTPTAIKAQVGDLLVIIASGEVKLGEWSSAATAEGLSNGDGALMGKLGVGAPFTVGAKSVIQVESEGIFKLMVRDNVRSDNDGAFEVMVLHIPSGAIPNAETVQAE